MNTETNKGNIKMTTTIGINPGTRFVAIAVVRNGLLLHSQIKSFQDKWSLQKLKAIIHWLDTIMQYYDATEMAIKVPDVFPTALPFNQLIGTLNVFFGKKGIQPQYHSLSDIAAQHCKGERKTRNEVMVAMARKHPELAPEFRKEQQNKNAHYYRLFIAVAVAHLHNGAHRRR